ncbi:MAG TPA: SRPBCC domain-containing protein [Kofleriaceae bacterium]|nr:SRPBCC domain-containing protein [Kofleriaceae bacterium]
MSDALAADRATVSMFVDVTPALAFEVFTTEIDQWWRHGPQYRAWGELPSALHLEPGLGGKITERRGDGGAVHEAGTITAWDPPHHLAFEWRGVNFAPGEATRVDIRFEARGTGTRVTLVHAGWASIRADHPVRHGKPSARFLADMGMWWTGLLRALAEHATSERG